MIFCHIEKMLADDGGWEFWVLDGEVEITLPKKADRIMVKFGYKCTFSETAPSTPLRPPRPLVGEIMIFCLLPTKGFMYHFIALLREKRIGRY